MFVTGRTVTLAHVCCALFVATPLPAFVYFTFATPHDLRYVGFVGLRFITHSCGYVGCRLYVVVVVPTVDYTRCCWWADHVVVTLLRCWCWPVYDSWPDPLICSPRSLNLAIVTSPRWTDSVVVGVITVVDCFRLLLRPQRIAVTLLVDFARLPHIRSLTPRWLVPRCRCTLTLRLLI